VSDISNNVTSNLLAYRNDVQNGVSQFAGQQLVWSDSPIAKFVGEVKNEDPRIATFALRHLINRGSDITYVPYAPEGIVRAVLFKLGVSDRAAGETVALQALRQTWQENFEKRQSEFSTGLSLLGADHVAKVAEIDALISAMNEDRSDRTTAANEQHTAFAAMMNESKNTLKQIERTYEQKLALQSSVQYWQKKSHAHWISAGVLAVLSGISGILFILLIYNQVEHLKASAASASAAAAQVTVHAFNTPETWTLVSFFLTIGLGVWALRLMIRFTLSNLHIASEASQRRTMVLTYLALLREETSALSPADKAIILKALFRPIKTGLVKDDAMPISGADIASRLTGGNPD
jgi:hypothetical protein